MKFTLALTRWHKVAERINAALKAREERSLVALTATTISPWNKEGVEEKARDIAGQARADIAMVEPATAAVAAIRTALPGRNAVLGISMSRCGRGAVAPRSPSRLPTRRWSRNCG